MSAKPTWASIRRSITKDTELTAVTHTGGAYSVPTEGHFWVTRTTNQGMYLSQAHHYGPNTNVFLHWSPASMIEVVDADRWIQRTNHGMQAWAILPDVPF